MKELDYAQLNKRRARAGLDSMTVHSLKHGDHSDEDRARDKKRAKNMDQIWNNRYNKKTIVKPRLIQTKINFKHS